jgi:EmrB/QacA subfamily drug resistance transporter
VGDKRLRMKGLPYKWKALLTVALGSAMATMDAGITGIAFPELTRVFHADLATVMWVSVVYILVSSSLMLVFGKLSDSVGRKRIYTVGMGIFAIAMAACGLARSIDQMIIFRAVQAVGAAMSIGCSIAIVTEVFPGEDMGRALGMLGTSVSVGFIIGPVAGGFLLDALGWPAIFYTRIPLAILAFALALILLKGDVRLARKANLDIWGVVASFSGLFCLLLGMGQIKARGLTSPMVIMLAGAGLFILCLLPLIECRAKEPIINFRLLNDRAFTCSMAGLFMLFLIMPIYVAIMPFYLLNGIGLSATGSGLLLSAIPIATMVVSPLSGALSDRFGARWPSVLGSVGVAAAFLSMSRFSLNTEIWMIASVLALLGAGTGAFQPPNHSTIMSAVKSEDFGSVSALIGTSRQVALSIGMALGGAVFSVRQTIYHDHYRLQGSGAADALRHSILQAFTDLTLIAVFPALTVVILSFVSAKKRSGRDVPHRE